MRMRPAAFLVALLVAPIALAGCKGMGGYPPPSAIDEAPAVASAYPAPGERVDEPSTGKNVAGVTATDLGGRALVIGTDATYPPFESVDDQGAVVGFDPALMTAICAIANCTATFQPTAWDGIFAALGAGEFDALMSAITILPEREAESGATFTVPYHEIGQVVLRRADAEGPFDAATAVVGVQTGTTGDTAATASLGVAEANMRRFDSNALAVQALLSGDVDAVVCDDPTAANYVATNVGVLAVEGPPFTSERYGILVPNSTPEVLSAFNAAIEQLRADGTLDALAAEWITAPADDAASGD